MHWNNGENIIDLFIDILFENGISMENRKNWKNTFIQLQSDFICYVSPPRTFEVIKKSIEFNEPATKQIWKKMHTANPHSMRPVSAFTLSHSTIVVAKHWAPLRFYLQCSNVNLWHRNKYKRQVERMRLLCHSSDDKKYAMLFANDKSVAS